MPSDSFSPTDPVSPLNEGDLDRIRDPDLRQRVAALLEQSRERDRQLHQTQLDRDLAAEMCQFKAGFLARVSHELRSPLSGLIGTHQLILGDLCEDRDEEMEFLSRAYESAAKMVDMLDIILRVARTEQGRTPLKLDNVRLCDLLAEVRELSRMQAANRNFGFEVVLPDASVQVRTSYKPLVQILLNAVYTAIDAMPAGSLRLSCAQSGDRVYIWLDSPCAFDTWNEPVDRLKSPLPPLDVPTELPQLSPGLKWSLDRTLLDVMDGDLAILEPPEDGHHRWVSRLQYSLPVPRPTSEPPMMQPES